MKKWHLLLLIIPLLVSCSIYDKFAGEFEVDAEVLPLVIEADTEPILEPALDAEVPVE